MAHALPIAAVTVNFKVLYDFLDIKLLLSNIFNVETPRNLNKIFMHTMFALIQNQSLLNKPFSHHFFAI